MKPQLLIGKLNLNFMRKYNFGVKTALAVFAVALSACSSDNDIVDNNPTNPETPVSDTEMSFSAVMDGVTTRTDFNNNSTIWAEGDQIRILNLATITAPDQSSYPIHGYFTLKTHTGGYTKEETFTGTIIQSNGDGKDDFFAYYPHSCKGAIETVTSGPNKGAKYIIQKGEVPTVQTAIDGSYDQSLHFMTARSNNSTFSFKNVCALLKITLTNSNISRIKVVANPKLTNVYDQSFIYTNIVGTFEAAIVNSDGTPEVKLTDTNKKTYVELRAAGDGGSANTVIGDGTYYMVVLPATLTNGFTLLLEKSDGSVIYQRVNTKTTAFLRNKMYDLGTYDCSGTPTGMTALTDVVDLDLPSGTLWATKNLKSSDPLVGSATIQGFVANETDYGSYFSWGKNHVQWTYANPSRTKQTLYGSADMVYSYSPFDHKYCTPIYAQMYEFYKHFPDEYKTSNTGDGAKGARFTAPTGTGRSIWLPYGGHYYSVSVTAQGLQNDGKAASYWSRTDIGSSGVDRYEDAYCLDLYENSNGIPVLGHNAIISGADSDWSDDKVTGRQLRAVASNFKIAPIYDDNGQEVTW